MVVLYVKVAVCAPLLEPKLVPPEVELILFENHW
jgi:hypothetical protein